MKAVSAPLLALLGSGQFYMADCYTFTLADGGVARFTTADQDLTDTATGNVFASQGALFQRSKVKFNVGVQVDELDIVVTANPDDTIGGQPWMPALRGGLFDGAEIQLDRAFMASFGDLSAGLLTIFTGRIAEIDVGRTQATIKANTHLELLTQQMPRRLFQPACLHTLFDARCTLTKASYVRGVTIGAGSTVNSIATSLAEAADWASLGTITFNSGALAGKSYSIRQQLTGGTLNLTVPVATAPAAGDTASVYPGCDRQQATCSTKFANLPNFGGFPYVPVPETAA